MHLHYIEVNNVDGLCNLGSSLTNKLRPKSAIPARSRVQSDQKIFKVPKGVAMFDYSDKYKVIATGGMDQVVRVWNPFVTK